MEGVWDDVFGECGEGKTPPGGILAHLSWLLFVNFSVVCFAALNKSNYCIGTEGQEMQQVMRIKFPGI